MVKRITIYGWAVPTDRFRGPGSGTFIELIYFLDDYIDVGSILSTIESAGYGFFAKRYPKYHPLGGRPERDRVTIEDITIGVEPLQPQQKNIEIYNPYFEGYEYKG